MLEGVVYSIARQHAENEREKAREERDKQRLDL